MMKEAIITTVETARTLSDLYLLFCMHSEISDPWTSLAYATYILILHRLNIVWKKVCGRTDSRSILVEGVACACRLQ